MSTAVTLNGETAGAQDLAYLAAHNYGGYTFFQVRQGAVRGLDLHLERLRSHALELFGAAPEPDQVRRWVQAAVGGAVDCSVRVTTASLDPDALLRGDAVPPVVRVQVSPPREATTEAIRVRTVAYERETPWVKHRATHGLLREQRLARQAGYDDALFVDRRGHLSEGSTWNLLVHDGSSWVWPEGPVLRGVTMQLLQGVLRSSVSRPVAPHEPMQAAFALNASSLRTISSIDERLLPQGGSRRQELDAAWAAVGAERL